jgi:hypothetical protein
MKVRRNIFFKAKTEVLLAVCLKFLSSEFAAERLVHDSEKQLKETGTT